MILPLLVFKNWTLLFLRLVVGLVFLAHGLPKAKDLKHGSGSFDMMGFRPGWLWITVAALLEVFGGILLILGAGTQLVSLLLAGEMLVTTVWKKMQGEKLADGYELDLILLASLLILATAGGGELALWF
jgi:putative oxidoreductase